MSERQRIEDLEILVSHQAHTIEELSEEVRSQWLAIERLQKGYMALGERFQELEDAAPRPEITKPPHY